jgi:hypothetical protein
MDTRVEVGLTAAVPWDRRGELPALVRRLVDGWTGELYAEGRDDGGERRDHNGELWWRDAELTALAAAPLAGPGGEVCCLVTATFRLTAGG